MTVLLRSLPRWGNQRRVLATRSSTAFLSPCWPTVPATSTDPTSAATDLSGRAGFDPDFLGVPVTLPVPVDRALPTVLLGYTHFSVLMRPDRRLAAVTGVGIDGATLRDLKRRRP